MGIPRHPHVEANLDKYKRIKILLEGIEDEYTNDQFMLEFPNESAQTRKTRAGLFKPGFRNITLDLLSAIIDAVFQEPINLQFKDEAGVLAKFSEDVTRGGEQINLLQYAKDFCAMSLRSYGQIWTVLDKPNYLAPSFEDELKNGLPYITNISPASVWNYEIIDGVMQWFAYKVIYKPRWEDPTQDPPQVKKEFRIWTRDELIIKDSDTDKIVSRTPHNFGFVPVIYQSFFLPPEDNTIIGIAPFFTTSNLIIMANNMKSVADMELTKFGNSVLLVNEQAISSMNNEVDELGESHVKLHDTKGWNQYIYHGEIPPQYLTKELNSIDKADTRAEMYFQWAIDNEKTMRSVMKKGATGQDLSESGIAKSFDAMPVLAGLRSTASDLESWCNKVLLMVYRVMNLGDPEKAKDTYTCEFPKTFDIAQTTLSERLKEVGEMYAINYPSETGIKEALKKITPQISTNKDTADMINEEIDESDVGGDAEAKMQKEILAEINNASNADQNNEDDNLNA